MGQSHIKSTEAPATAPACGKDAATLNPHLGPALKTRPSWSLGRLLGPEARGPQAEHGEASTFCRKTKSFHTSRISAPKT